VLADTFVEEGLPGHEPEAEFALDHGEAATDETGKARELPTDIFAGIAWRVGQATLSRHLPRIEAYAAAATQQKEFAGQAAQAVQSEIDKLAARQAKTGT
jgi:hypothetical protein